MSSAGPSQTTQPVQKRSWRLLGLVPWFGWVFIAGVTLLCCSIATWGVPKSMLLLKIAGGLFGILILRQLFVWRKRPRLLAGVTVGVLLTAVAAVAARTHFRYQVAPEMAIPMTEYGNQEYPEDPAIRSPFYGKYNGRTLTLIQNDPTHFDFVLESDQEHVATIVFKDVDVSLMTPSVPEWTKGDEELIRIALTDRQWNRQQVTFDRESPHLEIRGGNGYELENLHVADLAKNCLNAGLWEVLLFVEEDGEKKLYYHGWFTFPLGHYKDVLTKNTGLNYWEHWHYLEHWFDPTGAVMRMEKLREVTSEREVAATFDKDETIINDGCQIKKRRTVLAENLVTWGDFFSGKDVAFASFIPPGRYSVQHPWGNRYHRMDKFEKAIVRTVVSPAKEEPLGELELVFSSTTEEGLRRFIASGIDFESLPQLPTTEYAKGLYMPMGIGVPPFHQNYKELVANPPDESAYFSFLLDEKDRWIDHHTFGIDGPVMHLDEEDENLLHVYFLSYERHSLVAHLVVRLDDPEKPATPPQ